MLLTGLFPAAGRARLVGLVYHLGALFAGFVPLFTARLAASGLGLQKAIFAVASVLEVSLVLLVVLRPRAREPHDDTAHLPEAP
jgi:SHS family lactate transporter-like MFS transporter